MLKLQGGALMAYDGVRHLIGQRETISMSGRKIQVDVLLDYDHVSEVNFGNFTVSHE